MMGKFEDRRKRGQQRDEMFGWHHWLDRHEFEQVPGDGDGQGSLVCKSPWGHKESYITDWLNWYKLKQGGVESEDHKGWQGNFWRDVYDHYLDCDNVLKCVYITQCFKLHILNKDSLLYIAYSVACDSCWLYVTLWTVAVQALLSMGFSRQE